MTKPSIAEEILAMVKEKHDREWGDRIVEAVEATEEIPVPLEPEPKPKPKESPKIESREGEALGGYKFKSLPFQEVFGYDPEPEGIPNHAVQVWEFGAKDGVPAIPDFYEPNKKLVAEISFAYSLGLITNIIGPTGCGKNTDLEFFCHTTKLPYTRLEMNEEISESKVFGKMDLKDGDTVFSPGLFPRNFTKPGIITIDEVSRAPAFALMMFQRPLDRHEFVLYESAEAEIVQGHRDCVIFMTDNTNGTGDGLDQYVASNVLDSATLNRVQMFLEADYANRTQERKVIRKMAPKMPADDITNLAKFSHLMHAGFKKGNIRSAFSYRNLASVCTMYNSGMGLQAAVFYNFIGRCSASEKGDVMESYRAVFGGDVTA